MQAVIDGVIGYPVSPLIEKRLLKDSKKSLPKRMLERLAQQSQTTDRREHTFGLYTEAQGLPQYYFVELARIRCDQSWITTLRRIDTTITEEDGAPVDGEDNRPFNAPFMTTDLVRWYLTSHNINAGPDPIIIGGGQVDQKPPGTSCFDLPYWDDGRYNWGNPSNIVNIPCTSDRYMSLWAYVLGTPAVIYPTWTFPVQYGIGFIVWYDGFHYICIQSHTSQPDWDPPTTFTLWNLYEIEPEVYEIGVAGRLVASVQSEDQIAAEWQAKRTFTI